MHAAKLNASRRFVTIGGERQGNVATCSLAMLLRSPGPFHVPQGLAVAADGTVYVADRENSRLQLFTPDGVYRGEWTDVARPCQVFIAPRLGWIYVAELGFHAGRWPGTGSADPGAPAGRVSVFDRRGALQPVRPRSGPGSRRAVFGHFRAYIHA